MPNWHFKFSTEPKNLREEMQRLLEKGIDKHTVGSVVVSFFDGVREGKNVCCRKEPEMAMLDRIYDFDLAVFWFREGIRRQSHEVMYELGARLTIWKEEPWTEHKNPELGIKLLWSASEKDEFGYAHYYLGRCYEEGVGVRRNLHVAWLQYKIADDKGHPGAKEAIERIFLLEQKEKDELNTDAS